MTSFMKYYKDKAKKQLYDEILSYIECSRKNKATIVMILQMSGNITKNKNQCLTVVSLFGHCTKNRSQCLSVVTSLN